MKSRLTAGVVVCLRTTLSGALPGLFVILCQARRALYRPHLNIIWQVFAEPNRRTNRLFLANMSMSSPAFTSDKHATIGDTLAPVSALSDRLPDGGDGRNALPSR
jgi:hypothetical protein